MIQWMCDSCQEEIDGKTHQRAERPANGVLHLQPVQRHEETEHEPEDVVQRQVIREEDEEEVGSQDNVVQRVCAECEEESEEEPGTAVQAELSVGDPNDKYEREADAVAKGISGMPRTTDRHDESPNLQTKPAISLLAYGRTNPQPRIQRRTAVPSPPPNTGAEAREEEESKPEKAVTEETSVDSAQVEAAEGRGTDESKVALPLPLPLPTQDEDLPIQSRASRAGGASTTVNQVTGVRSALRFNQHGGRPIEPDVRAEMERGFGRDFSQVRIHTDGAASRMNRDLRARAITHQSDIYFRAGEYRPESSTGRELLAHELTHTIQQGAVDNTIQRYADPPHNVTTEGGLSRSNDELSEEEREELRGPNRSDVPEVRTTPSPSGSIQRLCGGCEGTLDPPANTAEGGPASKGVADTVYRTINSPDTGAPIRDSVRSRVEPVLGADLLGVRVHSGPAAHDASRALRATAFTHKNDIYLGRGASADDAELLAHEATHAVQQGSGRLAPRVQRRIVMRTTTPEMLDLGWFGTFQTGTRESLRAQTDAEVESYVKGIGTAHRDYDDIIRGTGSEFDFVATPSYRRQLVVSIIRNLQRVDADLFFDGYQELVREVRKRALISLIMRASQSRTRGSRPTGYPRSCAADPGPRVSQAAAGYWIVHPSSSGKHYWFELSGEGKKDAYEALRTLIFNHQGSACLRTLMHCDYMVSAQHYFVMAEVMGATDFNEAVSRGDVDLEIRWDSYKDIVADASASGQAASLQKVNLASEREIVIGDHLIFFNHDAFDDMNEVHRSVRGNYSNWRLENAIVTDLDASGEFRFQGHGYHRPKKRSSFVVAMVGKMNELVDAAETAIRAGDHDKLGFSAGSRSFQVVRAQGAGWRIHFHKGLGTGQGQSVLTMPLRRFTAADYPDPFVQPGRTGIDVYRPIESRRETIDSGPPPSSAGSVSPLPLPAGPAGPPGAPRTPTDPSPVPSPGTVPSPVDEPAGTGPKEPVQQAGAGPSAARGGSCQCDASAVFDYDAETFAHIGRTRRLIRSAASDRGVPAIAVAGSIADEYNTRRGGRVVLDAVQDVLLDSLGEWMIDVDRFFDIDSKILNALENDVGLANINVRTALEMVERGELEVPGSPASSPRVTKIIDFLLTNRGTSRAAAAVIARAEGLLGSYLRGYPAPLREAVFVTYFKQGDSYHTRAAKNVAADPAHEVCPGDGGCRVMRNRSELANALGGDSDEPPDEI